MWACAIIMLVGPQWISSPYKVRNSALGHTCLKSSTLWTFIMGNRYIRWFYLVDRYWYIEIGRLLPNTPTPTPITIHILFSTPSIQHYQPTNPLLLQTSPHSFQYTKSSRLLSTLYSAYIATPSRDEQLRHNLNISIKKTPRLDQSSPRHST